MQVVTVLGSAPTSVPQSPLTRAYPEHKQTYSTAGWRKRRNGGLESQSARSKQRMEVDDEQSGQSVYIPRPGETSHLNTIGLFGAIVDPRDDLAGPDEQANVDCVPEAGCKRARDVDVSFRDRKATYMLMQYRNNDSV